MSQSEVREAWADSGRLPESFSQDEIKAIEIKVSARVRLIEAFSFTRTMNPNTLESDLAQITALRKRGLVSEEIYADAVVVIKFAIAKSKV